MVHAHCACGFLSVAPSSNLQTFVGLTALLAAFPPCLGTGGGKEDLGTQPPLSGSVCNARDSLDFLDVSARLVSVIDSFTSGSTLQN